LVLTHVSVQVWGAAQVLSLILDNNGVCQEIAVATPLELPMSDKPPEQVLLPYSLRASHDVLTDEAAESIGPAPGP